MVGKKAVVMSSILVCILGVMTSGSMELMVETEDGKTVSVDPHLIRSKTLSAMITDSDDALQEPISLPISVSTLALLDELGNVLGKSPEKDDHAHDSFKKASQLLHDKNISLDDLVALLNAANYLGSEIIMEITSQVVAHQLIKEFNSTGILGMLNMVKKLHFTPELSEIVGEKIAQEYSLIQHFNLPHLIRAEIQNNPPSFFAFSDDKSLLALVINNCSKIRIWNIVEAVMVAEIPTRACVTALSFPPSKQELVVAAEDKTVKLWNLSTIKYRLLPLRQVVHMLSFSPDGKRFVTSSLQNSKWVIQLWDTASFENPTKTYFAKRKMLFNDREELIADMTPAYQRTMKWWYIMYPELAQELRHLSVENTLIIRWILEMIVNDKKICQTKLPKILKDEISNLVIDKPTLKKILQHYLVGEKSWCTIA